MTERIEVALGDRSYDILIGERLLSKAGELIAPVMQGSQAIVIADKNVGKFYLHRLGNALDDAGIRHRSIVLEPGEHSKSLESFNTLIEDLLRQQPDRKTTLIALGGGVIGDITGFAASVLLRGVDFIQIPTTLLAQIDSSVGGKTAINSRLGKNLIGSFHQPRLVLADISTLATLPKRELMAGYGEMLKYALIGDADFFSWLETHATEMLAIDPTLPTQDHSDLIAAIVKSCKAKAAIVAADEREAGARALLNFGHTFAHALEAETGFSELLLHGEAVAIGMMLATQLSVKLGECPQEDLERIRQHYQAMELLEKPRHVQSKWDVDALMQHFTYDKKAENGSPTFILSKGIGQAFIQKNNDMGLVREILASACSGV
ncbi:MAG: 3-dehydroquinate synthase [Rickettsiales bacterium]